MFTNTTSITMPDNETIVEMHISVKNRDNTALQGVSRILLSPAVMDQVIGAVGKAIEVDDKTEAAAIKDSIRKAFINISGGQDNVTNVTNVTEKDKKTQEYEPGEVVAKQTAELNVHLSGEGKDPV